MNTARNKMEYPPADERAWRQIIEGDVEVLPFVWLSISPIIGCGLRCDINIQGDFSFPDNAYPVVL
ncbi:hypothetical protein [Methanospirillum sp.]|uniref:hypothetical protein n=1 Tax=Methanospirillum sp. TaxID=45200 RepID=UPI002D8013E3|nr:hypothetical protein [Methanospirillum sp.]